MTVLTKKFTKKELDEVFPHPPLREVAFEIRFTPRLRVHAEIWRLQDQLVATYPDVSSESSILSNGAVLEVNVFQDTTGSRVIKVSSQNYVIAFSRYTCFEDFKDEVAGRAEQFCSTFGITSFTRLGLRYVNEVVLPTAEPASLIRYVRPFATFDRFPLDRIEQFATEFRSQYQNHLVTVRGVLLPGVLRTYVLDIDCYTESSRSAADFQSLLDDFHGSAQQIFLDHITDDYKAVMRGTV